MLKIALTACCFSAAFFFAGPKIFYSGFQPKWPIGSGVKVVPDLTNVWSWHFENVNKAKTGKVEIVIDQNGDGKPDQLDSFLAVGLTDSQFDYGGDMVALRRRSMCMLVAEDGTHLWNMAAPPGTIPPSSGILHTGAVSHHFSTPLLFPRGKRVFLTWNYNYSVPSGPFFVHLVGRTVNL